MGASSLACLVEITLGEVVRTHIIGQTNFILGRALDTAIPLLNPTSSRYHFRIEIRPDGTWITDLESNNGTFVDGKSIPAKRPTPISSRNIVTIGGGTETFRFRQIPLPVELMDVEQKRAAINKSLDDLRKEIEQKSTIRIEEERQKNLLEFRNQQETAYAELKARVDEKLRNAEDESQKKISAANLQSEKLLSDARTQAEQYIAEARAKADELLSAAKTKADEFVSTSKAQSDRVVASANIQSQEMLSQARTRAEKEAREILKKATDEAENKKVTAQRDLDRREAELKSKIESSLKNAHDTAAKIVSEATANAQKNSQEMMQTARDVSKKLEKEAQDKVSKIISNAEAEGAERAKRLILEAEREALSARKIAESELKEWREDELKKARSRTLQEQEKILAAHRQTIDDLKQTKLKLETETNELAKDLSAHKSELSSLAKELVGSRSEQLTLKTEIEKLSSAVNTARETIKAGEQAEKERLVALQELQIAKNERENQERVRRELLNKVDDEFKRKHEEETIRYDAEIKKHAEESARIRLESINRLKSEIESEERKFRQTAKQRSIAISKKIEDAFHIKWKKEKGNIDGLDANSLTAIIQSSVNDVVLNSDFGIDIVTEHLGKDVDRDIQKRKRIKRWASVAAIIVTVSAAANWEKIYNLAVKVQNEPGYVDYLIAKRNAESQYIVEQNSEWRETYVGNIIYLRHYFEVKSNDTYQKEWALRLHDVEWLRSVDLKEDDVVQFLGRESALITELKNLRDAIDAKFLNDGLAKMNSAENEALQDFKTILRTEDAYEKIRALEKDFVLAYIEKQFSLNQSSENSPDATSSTFDKQTRATDINAPATTTLDVDTSVKSAPESKSSSKSKSKSKSSSKSKSKSKSTSKSTSKAKSSSKTNSSPQKASAPLEDDSKTESDSDLFEDLVDDSSTKLNESSDTDSSGAPSKDANDDSGFEPLDD